MIYKKSTWSSIETWVRKVFVQFHEIHDLKFLKPIQIIQHPLQVHHYQMHLWLKYICKIDFQNIHLFLDISTHPTLSISMRENQFVSTFRRAKKAYENSQHDSQQNSKYRYLKISAYHKKKCIKNTYIMHALNWIHFLLVRFSWSTCQLNH